MRHPSVLLHRLARVSACVVLALAATAWGLERSGWLKRYVEARLVEILGAPLSLGEVRLAWLDAALWIEDLDLGLEQDALELDSVRVVLRAGPGLLPRPALIDVRSGRVVAGDELEARIAAIGAGQPAGAETRAPAVVLRDVEFSWRDPALGVLPLGRVYAAFQSDERGRRNLTGHLVPGMGVRIADAQRSSVPLYLSGEELAPGDFALRVAADGSPFAVEDLPEAAALSALRATGLRGRLSVWAELRVSLAHLTQASGHLRARLSEASLSPTPESAALTDLSLDLDARCAPGPGEDASDWGAWRALLRLGGSWRDAEFEGWGVFGTHAGPGRSGRAWVSLRDLPLDQETVAALRLDSIAQATWRALDPRGKADATLALELDEQGHRRMALEVECRGETGLSYVGWPVRPGGAPQGFPMPAERVSGRLVAAIDVARSPRLQLAILDARASHALDAPEERVVWLRGQVLSELTSEVVPEWDMRFGALSIPVDDVGIPGGLRGLDGTDWIWPAFNPMGGEVSFEAAMQRVRSQPGLAAEFRVRAEGLGLAWSGMPLPLQADTLELVLRFDPEHTWGVAFRAQGRGQTSAGIRVAGRLWGDPQDRSAASEPVGLYEEIALEIDDVSLRGADRQILGVQVPQIEALLEQIAAAGKVDVALRSSVARPGDAATLTAEISPREVALSPQAFRVQTRDVRGRVLVLARSGRGTGPDQEEPARVRLAPLVGEWPGGARVACTAEVVEGRGELRFQAAGLDPLNRGLVGALQASVVGTGSGSGLDLSALSVDGRVDAHGQVPLAPESEARPNSRFHVFLRDNDFRIAPPSDAVEGSGFGLTRLNGVLVQEGQELSGSGIRAQLGRTPLELREARFALDGDGFRLETRPSARGLPLDREHLRYFLDPGAVDALLGELDFGGTLDIDDARLVLSGRAGKAGRVSFEGRVTPRDLRIDLGLPVSVSSAAMQIESLVFESGHVRAWATVEDLVGQIAGRQLEQARLQLTYVEPHLSILDLDGKLEGGRLAHLGGEGTAGAPAFSIDLAAPFPFDMGLSLSDVAVQGLLRGVFESEFASYGFASGELRLTGDLEQVRSIRGDGWLNLRDSTLWSIPVVRDLFSQLGFDNTAVFERMRMRFAVRDGAVEMDTIGVYSPLLQLIGSGSLDFEGRLNHDLEVRYSLVDNLGPFRRALYWIQNNLLRIEVRGDMSRPRVEISGLLSFMTSAGTGRRDLPLPPLTPLPERF